MVFEINVGNDWSPDVEIETEDIIFQFSFEFFGCIECHRKIIRTASNSENFADLNDAKFVLSY